MTLVFKAPLFNNDYSFYAAAFSVRKEQETFKSSFSLSCQRGPVRIGVLLERNTLLLLRYRKPWHASALIPYNIQIKAYSMP